ncbi:3-oxoacyl-ACP reductase [Bacillus subtilis]|nr:3-oxoacyl-ACP reductase [Bacillus subtilis]
MNVLNKIALVTGGGTGIGKAASMELAKRGAIVAVNYSRSQSEAEETVEMIQKAGGKPSPSKQMYPKTATCRI